MQRAETGGTYAEGSTQAVSDTPWLEVTAWEVAGKDPIAVGVRSGLVVLRSVMVAVKQPAVQTVESTPLVDRRPGIESKPTPSRVPGRDQSSSLIVAETVVGTGNSALITWSKSAEKVSSGSFTWSFTTFTSSGPLWTPGPRSAPTNRPELVDW